MAIRSGALSEKEHVYLRSQVDEAARGDIQDAIEQGDVPQKSLKDTVDDYKELVRTREVGLPEASSREISTLHVIAHEGAHSLDKARGWASVSGEFGPFGGNGIVDEKGFAGKGKFSRTETTDYVSHYAQDHTGLSLPRRLPSSPPSPSSRRSHVWDRCPPPWWPRFAGLGRLWTHLRNRSTRS